MYISSYEQFSNWSQSPEANKSSARRRVRMYDLQTPLQKCVQDLHTFKPCR